MHLSTADYEDIFFPNIGNIQETNAKAIGAIIGYNDVRGDAKAYIKGATVDAGPAAPGTGDIVVSATNASIITSYATSTVEASGGSGINGEGKVAALNGQIVTNVVLGDASATIENSVVDARGDIDVSASNEARIDARLYSSGLSGADAKGVTIAYNSVGWEAQNVLFNTLDTLLGAPYLADNAFDGNVGADAYAAILSSGVDAGGALSVRAESEFKINATVSNAAVTETAALYGASGKSFGAIIAGNKASGKATALIGAATAPGSLGSIVSGGEGVTVAADDSVGIFSNVKLVVETTVTNDGGAAIIQETLNDLFPADYDTKPDPGLDTKIREIKFGDRIRIADDFGGNVAIDLNRLLPPSKFPDKGGRRGAV